MHTSKIACNVMRDYILVDIYVIITKLKYCSGDCTNQSPWHVVAVNVTLIPVCREERLDVIVLQVNRALFILLLIIRHDRPCVRFR